MKIAIACDHGAVALKNQLISYLEKQGHELRDFGTYEPVSCDYPIYAAAAARAVAGGECDRGIVLCTTGIGMSIAANKVKGIRCALLHDLKSATMTRQHNDTNMMALGAGIVSEELAYQIADVWLNTEFSGAERHVRRNALTMALENE
jgi:ribose 5-phosphate isomerase B